MYLKKRPHDAYLAKAGYDVGLVQGNGGRGVYGTDEGLPSGIKFMGGSDYTCNKKLQVEYYKV